MTPTLALIIWLTLPAWVAAVYFNIRKHDPEPMMRAAFNGTVLWLMFGGVLLILA